MHNDGTGSPGDRRPPYGVSNRQRDEIGRIEAEMRETLGEAEPDGPRPRGPQRSDRDAIDDEYVFIHRLAGARSRRANRVQAPA